MTTPLEQQTSPIVQVALICETIAIDGDAGRVPTAAFLGFREFAELPESGPYLLDGWLILRFVRTTVTAFDIQVAMRHWTKGPFGTRTQWRIDFGRTQLYRGRPNQAPR